MHWENPSTEVQLQQPAAMLLNEGGNLTILTASDQQESDLVEWYESHPQLYDKNHRQYHNKAGKTALLEVKAKEFPDCTYEQQGVFFKSQKTRFGKLSQRANVRVWCQEPDAEAGVDLAEVVLSEVTHCASGGPTKPEYICNFTFDRGVPHSRTSSEDECDPIEGPYGSTIHPHSKRSKTTGGSSACSTTGEEREAGLREQVSNLMQQVEESRNVVQIMAQPQTTHEMAVDTFLGFLKTQILKIPHEAWFSYTIDALMMARDFSHQMGNMGQQ
ncbi:uncharacterized protein LOC144595618 [Rhinoraja longicauda]